MSSGMFRPVAGSKANAVRRSSDAWTPVLPVPGDAPPPPQEHPKRGKPSRVETYRDRNGVVLGYVLRFDDGSGGKEFLPLTWCRQDTDGRCEWRWKGFPVPRPLFGLDWLAARPDAPVILCEGEKAAEAAGQLLPGHVAVTAPNGVNGAGKADWGPLARRVVVVWPDADSPGLKYAAEVARRLRSVSADDVRIIEPPATVPAGWDAADAVAEGWTVERATALTDAARVVKDDSPEINENTGEAARHNRKLTQRNSLMSFLDGVELWQSPMREVFVTVPVSVHMENMAVRSRSFELWLAGRYYDATEMAPGDQALKEALRIVEARAISRGPTHPIFVRVGEYEGAIYLDLGDEKWRAVRVTAEGWGIVENPPVKFLRSQVMASLPEPERGESIDRLRSFVNVASDDDFRLIVAWLVTALRPCGPYPLLIMNGEQGSAKSTTARVIQELIDPSNLVGRGPVRDERDLFIAAHNSWCLSFDNISVVADWLSDALCRISTGGGFATRELHSNRSEVILKAQRPIILNGIPDLTSRADLADRCITVTLPAIPEDRRRSEADYRADFDRERPFILGALLDAVSGALRRWDEIKLERSPRMADFARWATAAEAGLGWSSGEFISAYTANRRRSVEGAIEADPVAQAARDLAEEEDWEGTPTACLEKLGAYVSESVRKSRVWPSVNKLKGRLRRAQAPLREFGITLDLDLRGGGRDNKRLIGIRKPNR